MHVALELYWSPVNTLHTVYLPDYKELQLDEEKINAQLIQLTDIAERNGLAIGIGHVKPQTLAVLKKQIPELQKKGFKFEFVSKLVD